MKNKNEHVLTTDLLECQLNIDISRYDDDFLSKSFNKRISELHYSSAEEYCRFLKQDNNERQLFLDSLQNSHSEYFRNALTFSVLESIILPSIILKKYDAENIEIRVWSCACASGQEPYSLAILFEELKSRNIREFDYRIFATDHSESQIRKARNGRYSAGEIDNLSLKRVKRWFTKDDEVYTINNELKSNIEFSVFDLFDKQKKSPPASIFGDFDIVVCANLFFYYKNEYCKIILDKISQNLAHEGFVITGESERNILVDYKYVETIPLSGIFNK